MKPEAVIFDMDGTLVDVSSIRHHVTGQARDFFAFHQASINCPPNSDVVDALRKHQDDGKIILIVTARQEQFFYVTLFWLTEAGIKHDYLFMRSDKDVRPDVEAKRDILARIQEHFTVVHAYDDNPNVIALWEEHDIPVTVVPGW